MKGHVDIGSSPVDEECAQVGELGYFERAQAECRRFIALIREKLGPEPEGAKLRVKGSSHDFGTYYEVVCDYDERFPESVEYAYRCESDAPQTWEG